mmetsp:Transcript_5177/g.14855  ORF Transcript_5177/g.14855 Transcript_5177/m.14855 type:complete len:206 (-) Transcript_5177:807-1424(-)
MEPCARAPARGANEFCSCCCAVGPCWCSCGKGRNSRRWPGCCGAASCCRWSRALATEARCAGRPCGRACRNTTVLCGCSHRHCDGTGARRSATPERSPASEAKLCEAPSGKSAPSTGAAKDPASCAAARGASQGLASRLAQGLSSPSSKRSNMQPRNLRRECSNASCVPCAAAPEALSASCRAPSAASMTTGHEAMAASQPLAPR